MAAFQNIGIDGYFKRYGFKYGIKRALFMINDIHIVKDYENKKILYYHKAQNIYLENMQNMQMLILMGLFLEIKN